MFKIETLVSISCMTLLTACGGGGGGGSVGSSGGAPDSKVTPDIPGAQTGTYETMFSKAEKTSEFGGVVVRGSASTIDVDKGAIDATGEFTHNTYRVVFHPADGKPIVYDEEPYNWYRKLIYRKSEPESSSENSDPESWSDLFIYRQRDAEGKEYEYVRYVRSTRFDFPEVKHYEGMMGVITNPKDIPTSGRATYNGHAYGTTNRPGFGSDNNVIAGFTSNSRVDVDFGTGTVNVALTDFTKMRDLLPIDGIKVKNMKISGNKFHGGRVKTYAKGIEVDITGPNTKHYSAGAFFGKDAKKPIPDEVGGIFGGRGDDGDFNVEYMAD